MSRADLFPQVPPGDRDWAVPVSSFSFPVPDLASYIIDHQQIILE